jgi:hypothetical protein
LTFLVFFFVIVVVVILIAVIVIVALNSEFHRYIVHAFLNQQPDSLLILDRWCFMLAYNQREILDKELSFLKNNYSLYFLRKGLLFFGEK